MSAPQGPADALARTPRQHARSLRTRIDPTSAPDLAALLDALLEQLGAER